MPSDPQPTLMPTVSLQLAQISGTRGSISPFLFGLTDPHRTSSLLTQDLLAKYGIVMPSVTAASPVVTPTEPARAAAKFMPPTAALPSTIPPLALTPLPGRLLGITPLTPSYLVTPKLAALAGLGQWQPGSLATPPPAPAPAPSNPLGLSWPNVATINTDIGNTGIGNMGLGNIGVRNTGLGNVGVGVGVGGGVGNIGLGNIAHWARTNPDRASDLANGLSNEGTLLFEYVKTQYPQILGLDEVLAGLALVPASTGFIKAYREGNKWAIWWKGGVLVAAVVDFLSRIGMLTGVLPASVQTPMRMLCLIVKMGDQGYVICSRKQTPLGYLPTTRFVAA